MYTFRNEFRLWCVLGTLGTLSLSGCNGLEAFNQKVITASPLTTSQSLQSGAPAPSPSTSVKPSPSPTPSYSATPTPMPSMSPVPVSGVTPNWLVEKSLNTWIEIPNTSGAGGAAIDAWGQIVLRDDTNELFILASGGHGDSSDNRVVSIRLSDNAPQWVLRSAPTPSDQLVQNSPYYADGKPSSRHNYQYNHWVPAVHRLMMFGLYGTWPAAWMYPTVDGFNPDTNTWDPAGTWPNMVSGAGFGVYVEKGTSSSHFSMVTARATTRASDTKRRAFQSTAIRSTM